MFLKADIFLKYHSKKTCSYVKLENIYAKAIVFHKDQINETCYNAHSSYTLGHAFIHVITSKVMSELGIEPGPLGWKVSGLIIKPLRQSYYDEPSREK